MAQKNWHHFTPQLYEISTDFRNYFTVISQGRVATHLRCDGIFNDSIITNFLVILTEK